jgi:thermitase
MVNHKLVVGVLALITSTASFSAEYVVKFKKDSEGFNRAVSQRAIGAAQVKRNHKAGNLVLVEVNKNTRQQTAGVLADLMKNPEVEYVVENFKFKAFDLPNDPEISKQWSVGKVSAEKAWKLGPGSRDVRVAVIDTGVDLKHSDLNDNLWVNKKEVPGNGKDDDNNGYVDDIHGWDFFAKDADPQDETSAQNPGHGTHCSGIVGAVGDNGKGISGMSQRVSIMALRFLGADGSGDLMAAVESIDYAIANGAQVISASWGAAVSASQAQPITEAISRANDKGILFVAAASNDGKNNDRFEVYPANTPLPNVITVAASGNADSKPSWSNYGKAKVSLSSPGEDIYSTLPKEKYGNLSGTSMATPLVSGLSALVLSHNPDLNPIEMKALLQASGTKVAIETACDCRVDAAAAVERARASSLTVIPQAATIAPEETVQFTAMGGKGPYQFSASSDSVATIDEKGLLTAKAAGEMTVSVTDSKGEKNESLKIRVAVPETQAPNEECPLGDPAMCQMMCVISPDLPWCQKG